MTLADRPPAGDVVLVDENDRAIGVAGKLAAHQAPGHLHRAFSVFAFDDDGRVLLQQRAAVKYHFGGRWANTCCGHPLPGEDVLQGARRRARDELGVELAQLRRAGSVIYQSTDADSGLVEYEYDHVVVARLASELRLNPDEVSQVRWVSPDRLLVELADEPGRFAPWLVHTLPLAMAPGGDAMAPGSAAGAAGQV